MVEAIPSSNNEFSADLYRALVEANRCGRLIHSPFSLGTALAMTSIGARGDTKAEIRIGLHVPEEEDDTALGEGYQDILAGFGRDSVFVANKLYSQVGYPLSEDYVNFLKTYFQTGLEQVDFSTQSKRQNAADRINKWVKSATKSKINEIISADSLNEDSRLVLLNAIYFKGKWLYPFKVGSTSKEKFTVSETKSLMVDMMVVDARFEYGVLPELDAEAIVIPYAGKRLSMVIIVPNAVNGLRKIQSSIGDLMRDGQSPADRLTKHGDVKLSVPKFKIETTLGNLVEILTSLGMESMFSREDADFGGMTSESGPSVDLCITHVIQKAYIEVDEQGTKAAAVTAVRSSCGCSPGSNPRVPKRKIFKVNRPFYFQIVDSTKDDLVLFSGHCTDPTQRQ